MQFESVSLTICMLLQVLRERVPASVLIPPPRKALSASLKICIHVYVAVGPPGESAGVSVDSATTTSTSARLYWTTGATHGRPVDHHMIEGKTEYNNDWSVLIYSKIL